MNLCMYVAHKYAYVFVSYCDLHAQKYTRMITHKHSHAHTHKHPGAPSYLLQVLEWAHDHLWMIKRAVGTSRPLWENVKHQLLYKVTVSVSSNIKLLELTCCMLVGRPHLNRESSTWSSSTESSPCNPGTTHVNDILSKKGRKSLKRTYHLFTRLTPALPSHQLTSVYSIFTTLCYMILCLTQVPLHLNAGLGYSTEIVKQWMEEKKLWASDEVNVDEPAGLARFDSCLWWWIYLSLYYCQ